MRFVTLFCGKASLFDESGKLFVIPAQPPLKHSWVVQGRRSLVTHPYGGMKKHWLLSRFWGVDQWA